MGLIQGNKNGISPIREKPRKDDTGTRYSRKRPKKPFEINARPYVSRLDT